MDKSIPTIKVFRIANVLYTLSHAHNAGSFSFRGAARTDFHSDDVGVMFAMSQHIQANIFTMQVVINDKAQHSHTHSLSC